MYKDQGKGIIERMLSGAILLVAMKFVGWGYIDADMAAYITAGGVTAILSAWAWWNNRPSSLLSRAGAAIPENAHLVVTASAAATPDEKAEVRALAQAASDKVTAKT